MDTQIIEYSNNQIKEELISAELYKELSKWTDTHNLPNCAKCLLAC